MAPQRRKIFPHLGESNSKDANSEVASASGKDAATTEAGTNDSNYSNDANDTNDSNGSYDNAKNNKPKQTSSSSRKSSSNGEETTKNSKFANASSNRGVVDGNVVNHLLPLPLVLTVLVCSGFFWISSFRDVMATGKPILDTLGFLLGQEDGDAMYLQYTKSTDWFDDSRGWKSKQGGLSTILAVTTDANNMGGLYVRKMAGAAGLAYHTTKLWPIVFHSPPHYQSSKSGGASPAGLAGASWSAGHFDPLLALGAIGDISLSLFYLGRLEDLKNAGAGGIGMAFVLLSMLEALIFGLYLVSRRMHGVTTQRRTPQKSERKVSVTTQQNLQEDPNSLPSRIVARTVLIVSSLISLVSLRDLFSPGSILSFVPRDDIYLEWTGAFLHSPPPDTVESDENSLEAPLFAGDKFVAQLMGLYLSLGCMFKIMSACGWSKGNRNMGAISGGRVVENVERSGVVSSKIFWKAQAFGNMMILGLLRLFTPAAKSASLDLRWHLMLVAYEMFILFLYGFW